MIGNIVLGLFIIGFSTIIMYYSNGLAKTFGRFVWAEQNLGSTRNFYLFVGMLGVIIGCFFVFQLIDISTVQESSVQQEFLK